MFFTALLSTQATHNDNHFLHQIPLTKSTYQSLTKHSYSHPFIPFLTLHPSISQSINQSASRSLTQSLNQLINQFVNRFISQPANKSLIQSLIQPINHSITHSQIPTECPPEVCRPDGECGPVRHPGEGEEGEAAVLWGWVCGGMSGWMDE